MDDVLIGWFYDASIQCHLGLLVSVGFNAFIKVTMVLIDI